MAAVMTSTTGHSPDRARGGFTLFELVAVLVLIATLLGLAAPSLRGFGRGRADADAAAGVLAMTRMARNLAATMGTVSRLNIDDETGTYWVTVQKAGVFEELLTDQGRHFRLADGMTCRLELADGAEWQPYVQFMPDGRTEQATITLFCRNEDIYLIQCPAATEMFRIVEPWELEQ